MSFSFFQKRKFHHSEAVFEKPFVVKPRRDWVIVLVVFIVLLAVGAGHGALTFRYVSRVHTDDSLPGSQVERILFSESELERVVAERRAKEVLFSTIDLPDFDAMSTSSAEELLDGNGLGEE